MDRVLPKNTYFSAKLVFTVSNFYLHLYVLLQDRKFREFELFTNSNFKQGLSSQMENLPFGAFKSMDWNLVEMDLF